MKDSNIYNPLWHKYKSAIVTKLRQSLLEPQEYQLFKHEFENNERKPKIVAPSGHNDMGERYRAKRQAAEADFYIGLILRQS